MDDRPQRIADYFVVVGLGGSAATKFEPFPPAGDVEGVAVDHQPPGGTSGCEGVEPLTDVSLIHSKLEKLPQGYKVLDTTVGGLSANVNSGSLFASPIYLCYRQGRDKPPILEIGVHHTSHSPSPSPGHEPLTESVGGRSASLSRSGRSPSYLTLKRGLLYGHNNAITGLCVIMPAKGEEPPPGYKLLKSLDLGKGLMGPSLYLCYCTSLVHPSSVLYTPELLTRYPSADHPEFPLPESVPLFCLPSGVAVEHWERHTPFPLPTFSTFALTNAQGQCMYGAVVSFYEPLTEHRCLGDMRKSLKINDEEPLHVNKCICILSHWPFFSAFKSFLSSVYRLSVSSNIPLPLERYVGNLMTNVPFPTFVRPRVQMQIGNENIVFSLPVQTPLPLSVSTHWSLLSSLEPDSCFTLLSLTLLEQKLVLHSSRPALLTWVGEALRSVLFPFAWQCTYIPVCPLAFSPYMQAPVPFIIGIDSQYFDVFEKPSDICVVDLDTGYITLSKEARALLESKPLPSRPSRQLRQRLAQLRSKVVGLDTGLDLAVEVAPMEYTVTYKTDLEAVDVEIREAFLHYFATIMGHYRKCLRPLLSAPSDRSHDISLLFDQQLFLKHSPTADSAFFSHFFDTQIFTAFIEQRSFAHTENTALAFFDECTEKIRQNPHAQLLDAAAIVSRRSDLPTVVALPPDDTGLTKGKTYSYPIFPSRLDPALFLQTTPTSASGNGMRPHLSQHCITNVQSGSPMVSRRTAAEKKKDNQALEAVVKSDVLWSKTLLSHVCSLWYVLLPPHLSNHWNKMAVLSQAFELLEDMRKSEALPNDEVCYRIVMEQCVKLGRPALAVKVYHQMIRAGIQPNAVTYGFYNKAVLESQWLNARIRWRACFIAITACIFLNNLKNEKNRVGSGDSLFGEADFSLMAQRRNSISSRKSIEALNVVGVAGGVASVEEGEGLKLHLPAASIHRGSVYKMTQAGKGGISVASIQHWSPTFKKKAEQGAELGEQEGEEPGLWSNVQLITGGQSPNASRMLSRITSQINQGTFPSITMEMTSCTQCPSCHSVLYDEQLMSGWSCDEADYKTSCPYCGFKMVASLTITITKTLPPRETDSPETPPSSTPQSPIHEDEEGLVKTADDRGKGERDGGLNLGSTWPKQSSSIWKKKQLRRAQPGGVLKGQSPNGIDCGKVGDVMLIRTIGESTMNTPTSEELGKTTNTSAASDIEDKLAGVMDNGPSTIVTPPRTDPLRRRAPASNEKTDEGEEEVGAASHAAKLTSYVNLTPVHQRSMSKGHDLEEPDRLGLGSYIAQMRARGHKRSTSAPIRARLMTTPSNGGGSLANHVAERQQMNTADDKKTYLTEVEPPHMVPYLSPVVLRKEVETLLSLDGPDALGRDELLTDKPIIYWNLVWYFSRLYLPTYLPLLKLRAFTKTRPDLKKHPVHLRVSLMWDRRFTEVREPLYLIWEGKVPGTMKMFGTPELKRRDSESQLQSLVARAQCGDLFPVICSLLKDRSSSSSTSAVVGKATPTAHQPKEQSNGGGQKQQPYSRSVYRETLFLKSVLNQSINTDLFDREFKQALQRVPRDLSSLLESQDHPPSGRALQCRRSFGPLQVI